MKEYRPTGFDMAIQRLYINNVTVLENPGKRSQQLVWPRNAPESAMTITRVTMDPGAISKPHAHAQSEQIWIVEAGSGVLLGQEKRSELKAGDVIRTPAGEVHGIENTGDGPLIYLSVTTPPEDFREHYQEES
jgi:mannose-6-phosphate isomerase-like protein (cupin superfamily)